MKTIQLTILIFTIMIIVVIIGTLTINKKTMTYIPEITHIKLINVDNTSDIHKYLSKNIKLSKIESYYEKISNNTFKRVKNGDINGIIGSTQLWGELDPALYFLSAIPFILTETYIYDFLKSNTGKDLYNKIGNRHNIKIIPCGISGLQLCGWWKTIPHSIDDIKGLKMKFHGIGGKVMEKLGAILYNFVEPSNLMPYLNNGYLNVVEWGSPSTDIKLRLYEGARYVMVPGWHELGSINHLILNKNFYNNLNGQQQNEIETICKNKLYEELTKYHYDDNEALTDLIKYYGINFISWNKEFLDTFKRKTNEIISEWSKKDDVIAEFVNIITYYSNKHQYEYELQINPILNYSIK